MFKYHPSGCENTILVLSQIPPHEATQEFSIRTICKDIKKPEPHTRKISQSLIQAEFLFAVRELGSGHSFNKHSRSISILDIIKVIDWRNAFDRGILGPPRMRRQKAFSYP